MTSLPPSIQHVSDTATWVAYHRAMENNRKDAFFHDPVAERLAGERGRQIDDELRPLSDYVQFQVIFRTLIIDRFITDLVKNGVDTILCLGAGLDGRPYRMNLPSVKWIEVDFEHVIKHKENVLSDVKPLVMLERVSLDLTDRKKRREFFQGINERSGKVVVLTEGVIPYLTEEQVSELASDLRTQSKFRYWITEYHSPLIYRMMRNTSHNKGMANARFQFMPEDWNGFFRKNGWEKAAVAYFLNEAAGTGRKIPPAPWASLFLRFAPSFVKRPFQEMFGMAIYEPVS